MFLYTVNIAIFIQDRIFKDLYAAIAKWNAININFFCEQFLFDVLTGVFRK